MAKPLGTLIVEDSEDDARLVVRELENAGFDVKWTRVETAPAMRAALGQEPWDLIIADFTMPQISAPAALKLLQEVGIDLPFIIVSGSVGEDIAVDAMKAGAHDYLVKGNLKRLAPAVQRELAEASNRRARHRAEENYRELVALAPIGIYQATRQGRLISANVALARILGYDSPDELLPLDMQADIYFDAADRPRLLGELERVGRASRPEIRLKRKDGTPVWVQIEARAVRAASGAFEQLEGFVHDIDQRRRTVEELRESEERFRRSFSASPVAMTLSEWQTGRIIDANEVFVRMLGYDREGLIGRTSIELGLWPDVTERERMVKAIEAGLSFREREVRFRSRSGEILHVLDSVEPLQLGGERVLLSVFQDVTERKRAEVALRASEERYRLLFENSPLPMWVFDNDTLAFLAVNQAACRRYGYSLDEFLSMTIKDIRPSEDVPALLPNREAEGSGFQRSGIWRHRKKDGTLMNAEVMSAPFVFDGRSAQLVLSIDVTDRLSAEEGMRKSEERFRKLFESNTIGIAIMDLAGRTLEANDAYLAMIGYTRQELLSGEIRLDTLTPPEYGDRDRAAVAELQRTGATTPWEKEIFRKDGSRVPVLIGVAMLQASEATCIAYIVDLSERRQLEEQFRQAQKMEAVGQLAGGVAHDFNNLLTAILGYADLLAGRLKPESAESEDLNEIRKAGERAAALTRQLLAFSRQQVLERKVLDLNYLIADVEKMLGRLIGEDITLVTALDPGLRRVWADAGQLEQVIMNLAVNARDAMPQGGKLTIETANVELDDAYARQHVTVRPGSFVMLAVSDNGTGMDAATLSRVFEPFFTTKERGRGTGLGLATVYGIVKQSGGHVWAYSEPGKGTSFKVYLPPAAEGLSPEEVPEAGTASLQGSETVLLVEDEESVRALSRVILENNGYTVLEAGSGDEALEIVRNFGGTIDLVLTDVVMPSMPGSTLVSSLETLRPGIKVLYMSGYTDDAVFRHGHLDRGRAFLQKPFTPDVLARKVREALKD
jgi:PAS domain S-box-containing protein